MSIIQIVFISFVSGAFTSILIYWLHELCQFYINDKDDKIGGYYSIRFNDPIENRSSFLNLKESMFKVNRDIPFGIENDLILYGVTYRQFKTKKDAELKIDEFIQTRNWGVKRKDFKIIRQER